MTGAAAAAAAACGGGEREAAAAAAATSARGKGGGASATSRRRLRRRRRRRRRRRQASRQERQSSGGGGDARCASRRADDRQTTVGHDGGGHAIGSGDGITRGRGARGVAIATYPLALEAGRRKPSARRRLKSRGGRPDFGGNRRALARRRHGASPSALPAALPVGHVELGRRVVREAEAAQNGVRASSIAGVLRRSDLEDFARTASEPAKQAPTTSRSGDGVRGTCRSSRRGVGAAASHLVLLLDRARASTRGALLLAEVFEGRPATASAPLGRRPRP